MNQNNDNIQNKKNASDVVDIQTNEISNSQKLDPKFRNVYIVSMIVVGLTFLSWWETKTAVSNSANDLEAVAIGVGLGLHSITFLFFSHVISIVTIIFGIFNYRKNKDADIRNTIKVLLLLLSVLNVSFYIFS